MHAIRRVVAVMAAGVLIAAGASARNWTPGDVGSPVKLWLDAADTNTLYQDASGTTPVTANGQTVLRWNDKSGNTNDLTSDNGPSYTTGIMNGNAVLAFDKDILERTNSIAMGNIGDNFAAIGVFKVVTNGANWDVWINWGVGGASGDPVIFVTGAPWANGPAQAMAFAYFNGSGMTTISPVTGEPAFIFAGILDQASSPRQFSIWRDGATNGTYNGSGGPSAALSVFRVGDLNPTRNPSGNIAELLLVNTGTTNTLPIVTRQRLEGYLAHKWWGAGAANPLPADHPYKASPPQVVWSNVVVSAAATSATATATLLNGIVGDPDASVTLFWDTADRGTSGWTYSNGPAAKTVGTVSMVMTGLTPCVTYYGRYYTTNVATEADGWSPTVSFSAAPALAGHWPLDDHAASHTVAASVGSAGTLSVDTSVASVGGIIGSAIDFANQYSLNIDAPGDLLTLSDFTVSAWVKGYANNFDEMVLVYSKSGGVIQHELQANTLCIYDGGVVQSSSLSWDLATWYHLVFRQQDGTTLMYRDGAQVGGPFTGRQSPLSLGATTLQIGSRINDYQFMGAIDDVAVWSGGLSATAIQVVHNLAVHALNYNAGQAQTLFNVYAGGAGSRAVIGSRQCEYATGLTGSAGEIHDEGNGRYSINMGDGAGVRITLPRGTIVLVH